MNADIHSVAVERDKYYSSTRVMQAIIHSLATRIIENRGDPRWLTEAYLYAIEESHVEDEDVLYIIEEYALFDTALCKREFEVTVTIPVTVTVTVEADSDEAAEEAALCRIEQEGMENLYPDYDMHYGVETDVKEL
jgi:hypothetical protein